MPRLLHAFVFLLAASSAAFPAEAEPPPPRLEFLCRLEVALTAPQSTGKTPAGERRIIPIVGGKVSGPRLRGEILNAGADWQWVRADGTAELDARYAFRTHDGALVMIHNLGVRFTPPEVAAKLKPGESAPPEQLYFRTTPRFETGDPRYAWLNNVVAVCSGVRLASSVRIDVYHVR
jgi:hypothetical protein